MKQILIWAAIIGIWVFFATKKSSYEVAQEKGLIIYNSNLTEENKEFIDKFKSNKTIISNDKVPTIKNGVFCIRILNNTKTEPYLALNKLFEENDYKMADDESSIKYLIVCERIIHTVGIYSNSGRALQVEIVSSILDLENNKVYEIIREKGTKPPNTVRRRKNVGAIGSELTSEEIFEILINSINI